MIWYLATHPHTYTIEGFLETRGQPLAGRFRVATYDYWLGIDRKRDHVEQIEGLR